MSQAYSNPDREQDPHALPDIELWQSYHINCTECDRTIATDEPTGPYCCPECELINSTPRTKSGWFYWYCFPGCLPDSDPVGPFKTKAEALADAQSNND